MVSYFIHIGLVCIAAYAIYYAVQYYRSTGDDSSLSSSEIKIPQSAQYSSDNEWEMNNLAAENELVDTIINERYLVGDVIAVGRTATVRSGMDEENNSTVVIKFAKPGPMAKRLDNEYHHYVLLEAEDMKINKFGIPNVMYLGEHGGYKVLVMEMLGTTLQQVKEMNKNKKLSGKSILKIATQMMDTFNYIHSKSIIFRDISASKIAIGNSKDTINKIFIFDFTSSAKVSSKLTPKHDLIQLGLVLLELNGVKFGAQTETDGNQSDINTIIESLLKEWDEIYVKELCAKADYPNIFLEYFKVLAMLKPNEYPNYEQLKGIFNEGLTFDEFRDEHLGLFDGF